MTEEEVRVIVRQTVRETLQGVGVDTANPGEEQRDHQFVRSWRQSTEAVKQQGLLTAIALFTTGVLGLIWVTITKGGS